MSGGDRICRVRDLFDLASRIPLDRAAETVERLEPDPSIRAEVLELLAIDRDRGEPRGTIVPVEDHAITAEADERFDELLDGHALSWREPTSVVVLLPGMSVHGCELVEPVAAGGSADVWKARRPPDQGGGWVAIKIMRPEATGLAARVIAERFERERLALGRVSHPGVVPLLGCGILRSGHRYLVLGWFGGAPLGEEGPPSEQGAANLLAALAALHEVGIAHRDLKPSNLLVAEDGSASIVDLGGCEELPTEAGERRDAVIAEERAALARLLSEAGWHEAGVRHPRPRRMRAMVVALTIAAAAFVTHRALVGRASERAKDEAVAAMERALRPEESYEAWRAAMDLAAPSAAATARLAHAEIDAGRFEAARRVLDWEAAARRTDGDAAARVALAHAAMRGGWPLLADAWSGGDVGASEFAPEILAVRLWSAIERGEVERAAGLLPAVEAAIAARPSTIAARALTEARRVATETPLSWRPSEDPPASARRVERLLASLAGLDPADPMRQSLRHEVLAAVKALAATHGDSAPVRIRAITTLLDDARLAEDLTVGDEVAGLIGALGTGPHGAESPAQRRERDRAFLSLLRYRLEARDHAAALAALELVRASESADTLLVEALGAAIDPATDDAARSRVAIAMGELAQRCDPPARALATWIAAAFADGAMALGPPDGLGAAALAASTIAAFDVLLDPGRPAAVRAVQALVATPEADRTEQERALAPVAPVARMAVEVTAAAFGPRSPPTDGDLAFLIWLGQELIARGCFAELATLADTVARLDTERSRDAVAILRCMSLLPEDIGSPAAVGTLDELRAILRRRCEQGPIDEVPLRLVVRLAVCAVERLGEAEGERWWPLIGGCRAAPTDTRPRPRG